MRPPLGGPLDGELDFFFFFCFASPPPSGSACSALGLRPPFFFFFFFLSSFFSRSRSGILRSCPTRGHLVISCAVSRGKRDKDKRTHLLSL